jgi:uncharacterized coiled-coil protein SlyX
VQDLRPGDEDREEGEGGGVQAKILYVLKTTLMGNKKEIGKTKPELQEIIDKLEQYKQQLYDSSEIGSMKFQHMQSALHWAKQIVRDCYGAPREKNSVAWIK